jgi:uncharacterized coiled-coil DUF342 family protein
LGEEEKEEEKEETPKKQNGSNVTADSGTDVIEQLQEALTENLKLSKRINELQEKLSVSYAKVNNSGNELNRYKNVVISLSESAKKAKELSKEVQKLQEKLQSKTDLLKSKNSTIKRLEERLTDSETRTGSLREALNNECQKKNALTESNQNLKKTFDKKIEDLTETFSNKEQNYIIKIDELKKILNDDKKMIESYKKITSTSLNRYIDLKALSAGVDSVEIKNRLTENYSFNDIDRICDSLLDRKLSLSKLPFDLTKDKIRVKNFEAVEPIKKQIPSKFDDEADSSLLALAGIDE